IARAARVGAACVLQCQTTPAVDGSRHGSAPRRTPAWGVRPPLDGEMTTTTVGLERLVYLTELTGLRLEGPNGARIGRVREAAVAPREHPRRISRYLFGEGKTHFQVRHDQIGEITLDRIVLADDQFIPYYGDESHLLLARDLLDQQIVDVNGRK